jgi:phosphoglycerate dehydrogenase-like enzyme
MDFTIQEPMSSDNVLLKMPNVCVTPHIGTATVETRNAMASIVADNIIAGLKGEKIPYPVNPEVYE